MANLEVGNLRLNEYHRVELHIALPYQMKF